MRRHIVIPILVISLTSFLEALPLQAPVPEIQSFIGQALILVGHGREPDVSYAGKDLSKPGRSCDGAVEVRNASYSGNTLRFELADIGAVQMVANTPAGQPARCGGDSSTTRIEIRDVNPDALAATLKSVSNDLLMSPETYLSRRGIKFDYPPVAVKEVPVGDSKAVEVVPKPLLLFQPSYTPKALVAGLNGFVSIQFVVGSDGRIQSPMILKGLGGGLDEQSLRILPLYRFEPAKQNGSAVAITTRLQFNFRLQ